MPTAPPTSLSTYELYKKATNELVTWLVNTGGSCGYGNPKSRTKFPLRYLRGCAEAISRKKTIEIPGRIIDTADDVIIGRQIYANWFGGQHDSDQESNGTHQHFNSTMKTIRQVLVQARKERKPQGMPHRASTRPDEASNDSVPEKTLANLFQYLRVEETSGETSSNQKTTNTARTREHSTEPIELLVETDEDEDARFALLCYLQDQAAIREFVKETWQQYARGELSFFVATTIAEEAYTCIDRGEHELTERGLNNNLNSMLEFLNLEAQYEERNGRITVDFVDQNTREASHLSELLCPVAYVFLTGVMHEWALWKDDFEQKRCETYTPSPAALDFAKRTHPFLERLLAVVPESCPLMNNTEHGRQYFAEQGDRRPIHLWWGFELTHSEGAVLVYPLMVLQSYMDMFDVVGDVSKFALEEYVKTVEQSKAAFDEMVEVRKSFDLESILTKAAIATLDYTEERLEEDVHFKDALLADEDFSTATFNSPLARNARLARCLPTALGARVTFLKLRMHDLDCRYANEGFIVPGMAYLYKAARWYDLVSVWPDLERLIALQTKASGSSFVKDVPKHGNPEKYADHAKMYCLGLAIQSKNHVSNKQRSKQVTTIDSGVEWEQLMKKHQKRRINGVEFDETNRRVEHLAGDRTLQAVMQDMARNATGRKQDSFSDIECLTALKQAWIRDEPELNFSYVGIWMSLTGMLNKLRQLIQKSPTELVRPFGTTIWTETVPAMLNEAFLYYDFDQKSKGEKQMKRSRLAVAAMMMESVTKSSGDRFIKQAEERSGGDGQDKSQIHHVQPNGSEETTATRVTTRSPDFEDRVIFWQWLHPPLGFRTINLEEFSVHKVDCIVEEYAEEDNLLRRLSRFQDAGN